MRRDLRRARRAGLSPREIEEAVLQTYLFAGYPRAINAFGVMREMWGDGGAPIRESGGGRGPWGAWARRGEALCRRVYGGQFARVSERMRGLHPDLARWMIVEGYGKVLARRGLSIRHREAAAVGALVALGAERQLRAHLSGALRVGWTVVEMERIVRRLRGAVGAQQLSRARALLERVAGASSGAG